MFGTKPTPKSPKDTKFARKKAGPQARAIAWQKAHGESLRQWIQDRRNAADKRRAEQREAAAAAPKVSRGVDRVPAHLRVHRPAPTYLVEYHDMPRAERRAKGYLATSGNIPHTNPGRDAKSLRSGRLRVELHR